MTAALVVTGDTVTYLSWGWLSVSVPNLIAILVTITVFVLALVLPFPRDRRDLRNRP